MNAANPSHAVAANGTGGRFYWRYSCGPDHIAAAVDALMEAVDGPTRLHRPHADRLRRKEFELRLKKAEKGQLQPPDELKTVRRRGALVRFFEIRWSGLAVAERGLDGRPRESRVDVRLYYAEPPQFGLVILGLHCHEKSVIGSDDAIKAVQNTEIDRALACYAQGMAERWGIDELATI